MTGGAASAHHRVPRSAGTPRAKKTISLAISIERTALRFRTAVTRTMTPDNQNGAPLMDSGDGGRHSATPFRIVSLVEISTA